MNAVIRKNLIFDLGGVLLELNEKESLHKFINAGISETELTAKWPEMQQVITKYETGKIGTRDFHTTACELFQIEIPFATFVDAWNGILDHFPRGRLEMLMQLRERHNLYLLSNTNTLHALTYEKWFLDQSGCSMHRVFTRVWYSHLLGMRKPDTEIFEKILEEGELPASECIFFDDNPDNVMAARKTNIQALQVTPETDIVQIIRGLHAEKVIS